MNASTNIDLNLDYISSLPDEIIFMILNMSDLNDIYNFLQTSSRFKSKAEKLYLIKVIETKTNLCTQDLYYKCLNEVKDIFNLQIKPGYLYEINIKRGGDPVKLTENSVPYIPGEFIKIYSDGVCSGCALTPDGRVFLLRIISTTTQKYEIVEPLHGEKYIDVIISGNKFILLSNKGKICQLSIDTDTVTLKEIFTLPDIKQYQSADNGTRCSILNKRRKIIELEPKDQQLLNKSGIYKVPLIKDIIQAHNSITLIQTCNFTMIQLNIFLDNQGSIYLLLKIYESTGFKLLKGPYKLHNFNNIVKVFINNGSYGFVTMYGDAYICVGNSTSIQSYLYSIETPRLLHLPINMRAKDITIDEKNIYLLLQRKR